MRLDGPYGKRKSIANGLVAQPQCEQTHDRNLALRQVLVGHTLGHSRGHERGERCRAAVECRNGLTKRVCCATQMQIPAYSAPDSSANVHFTVEVREDQYLAAPVRPSLSYSGRIVSDQHSGTRRIGSPAWGHRARASIGDEEGSVAPQECRRPGGNQGVLVLDSYLDAVIA